MLAPAFHTPLILSKRKLIKDKTPRLCLYGHTWKNSRLRPQPEPTAAPDQVTAAASFVVVNLLVIPPHLNHGLTGREGHGSSIVDRMRASRAAPRGPRQTDWRRQALEQ
jgi:hypothetical protein